MYTCLQYIAKQEQTYVYTLYTSMFVLVNTVYPQFSRCCTYVYVCLIFTQISSTRVKVAGSFTWEEPPPPGSRWDGVTEGWFVLVLYQRQLRFSGSNCERRGADGGVARLNAGS